MRRGAYPNKGDSHGGRRMKDDMVTGMVYMGIGLNSL